MSEPWERQKGESRQAFAAFCTYRDLGVTRSIVRASETLAKSGSLLSRWSQDWHWVARTNGYDDHLAAVAVQQAEQESREMVQRHARLSVAVLNLVAKRLAGPDVIDHRKLDAQDVARLLDTAVKIERAARGVPDITRQEVTGKDGGPVVTAADPSWKIDYAALSDEEIALLDKILPPLVIT